MFFRPSSPPGPLLGSGLCEQCETGAKQNPCYDSEEWRVEKPAEGPNHGAAGDTEAVREVLADCQFRLTPDLAMILLKNTRRGYSHGYSPENCHQYWQEPFTHN